MINIFNKEKAFVVLLIVICIILWLKPTSFEGTNEDNAIRCKAKVVYVDNSDVHIHGIVKTGAQRIVLEIINGKYKGHKVEVDNNLLGKLELDKVFNIGDKALVVIEHDKGNIVYTNIIDFYRINLESILLIAFILLLVILAGWVGVKSVLSFIFTILMIWKVLLPFYLNGHDPIIIALLVVSVLNFVIIFLVADFTKKGLSAFLGSMLGMILTCILAVTFGKEFRIHGAVVPFAETLLYSGYANLDLTRIFYSSIFIASSGAVMDVSMDIAASINEVVDKKPNISTKEAILSGINVSKAILGTMTTTLLLAYSGGYTAMLMVFMAQSTPIYNILNITYVASEILHTLVGSFGLIMVAPFTAFVAGIIFTRKKGTIL